MKVFRFSVFSSEITAERMIYYRLTKMCYPRKLLLILAFEENERSRLGGKLRLLDQVVLKFYVQSLRGNFGAL